MKGKPVIPPMFGVTGAARALEVTRQNMPNTMKAKDFPAPDTIIDGRPFWLQETILEFKKIHIQRKHDRKAEKQSARDN